MNPMTTIWLRMRRRAFELLGDRSGVAAVEFAMIIPVMAVLLLGTFELSSAVAVNRKVVLMARTLSDLTSQNTEVTTAQLDNFFNASKAIMTPYPWTPVKATITELYVDPDTKQARVQWSKGVAPHEEKKIIPIPAALQTGGTYLIFSEVSYNFIPGTTWFIFEKDGIKLSDFSYTRPRYSKCVDYPPPASPGAACTPK
ncbi:Flp pilus assembly protein TadG [Bradyrhizobium sp. AZCC 1610]|uniref:TadE/TadG family type IV pilus assembly protein n=1 Tax=Bradyrhizobium sp. AZCC 1610 TaxID=3117020 RepID=UPI00306E4B6B